LLARASPSAARSRAMPRLVLKVERPRAERFKDRAGADCDQRRLSVTARTRNLARMLRRSTCVLRGLTRPESDISPPECSRSTPGRGSLNTSGPPKVTGTPERGRASRLTTLTQSVSARSGDDQPAMAIARRHRKVFVIAVNSLEA